MCDGMERVSLRLMWVKVNFGRDLRVFVSAYGPASMRDGTERFLGIT